MDLYSYSYVVQTLLDTLNARTALKAQGHTHEVDTDVRF